MLIAALITSFSVLATELTPFEKAKELRAAAETGDTYAMLAFAMHLIEYAPGPKVKVEIVNSCNGKQVTSFAMKKLQAKGQSCHIVEREINRDLVEMWRPIGFNSDSLVWFQKIEDVGNFDSILAKCPIDDSSPEWLERYCYWSERCATEKNSEEWHQKFCSWIN